LGDYWEALNRRQGGVGSPAGRGTASKRPALNGSRHRGKISESCLATLGGKGVSNQKSKSVCFGKTTNLGGKRGKGVLNLQRGFECTEGQKGKKQRSPQGHDPTFKTLMGERGWGGVDQSIGQSRQKTQEGWSVGRLRKRPGSTRKE